MLTPTFIMLEALQLGVLHGKFWPDIYPCMVSQVGYRPTQEVSVLYKLTTDGKRSCYLFVNRVICSSAQCPGFKKLAATLTPHDGI